MEKNDIPKLNTVELNNLISETKIFLSNYQEKMELEKELLSIQIKTQKKVLQAQT